MGRKKEHPKLPGLRDERFTHQRRLERLYSRLRRTWNAFDKEIKRLKKLEKLIERLETESNVAG